MSNRVKGVTAAVNRETSMEQILQQLAELSDQQLGMVSDYIKGLRAAERFLFG